MTYCASVSFVKLADSGKSASNSRAKKLASRTKILDSVFSGFQLNKWIALLGVLNILLVFGSAVFVNQSSVSGYEMAKLEAEKTRLAKENAQMEVNLAVANATRQSAQVVEGFVPVASVEYVGQASVLSAR